MHDRASLPADYEGARMRLAVQTQSTCYLHASLAWMGSIALITNPTDRTGRVRLTPNMTLSVQPFVDCLPGEDGADPCSGGRPDFILR